MSALLRLGVGSGDHELHPVHLATVIKVGSKYRLDALEALVRAYTQGDHLINDGFKERGHIVAAFDHKDLSVPYVLPGAAASSGLGTPVKVLRRSARHEPLARAISPGRARPSPREGVLQRHSTERSREAWHHEARTSAVAPSPSQAARPSAPGTNCISRWIALTPVAAVAQPEARIRAIGRADVRRRGRR